ncbi:serine/threonine protein kinase [Xylographa carneopallida]|nr:serine/threonine protein kinase [Xylographa carneopallida]
MQLLFLSFCCTLLHACLAFHDSGLWKYGKPVKLLGEGAGGLVHLYHRLEDSAKFAVKEFDPENGFLIEEGDEDENLEDTASSVQHEFRIATSLRHDNIIEALDLVYENRTWFMVMPYYPQSLSSLVESDGVTVPQATCIFRQLLDGVSYMHAEGYAHHDLKVNNVVLDSNGSAKIIDFGTSYQFRGLDSIIEKRWGMFPCSRKLSVLSNPSEGPVGALTYLPPEVYETSKYDPRPVDIWALAMSFCRMLLPNLPWKTMPVPCDALEDHFGLFSWQAMRELRQGTPSSSSQKCRTIATPDETKVIGAIVSSLLRQLPPESSHIIGRMLEPRPEDRAGWSEILGDEWVSRIRCPSG